MKVELIEAWLQAHSGLVASTLGAGVVARAARDRIEARGCRSVEDYIALLETVAEERHALIERVIVPETWFFRDAPAFEALARHVGEVWSTAHTGSVFRVLSVPCSTGEEAYSITMALDRAGWPMERLRVEAIDISRENLAFGREGVYRKNSFRGTQLGFRDTYFDAEADGTWRVREEIRRPITFEHGNLLAPDFAVGRGPFDAIFCRNLLIYFDRETQARAIRTLATLLAPGGWIAVGPAEPVLLFEHDFAALPVPSGFLLERAPKKAPRVGAVAKPPSRITRKAEPVVSHPRPRPPAPRTQPAAPPTDTIADIQALADAGKLADASRRGEALLKNAGASPELLYLLGVMADAMGDLSRAETYYRKAVYLDPRHGEALSHLALLAERKGDAVAARQFQQRARKSGNRRSA